MAGSITVSSITLDSDNTFRILSNTGSSLYTLNSVNQAVTGNLSVDATGTTGIRAPSANTLVGYTAGVEAMRIDSSGNVGIGTSPAFPLDISAASGTTARIKSTGNYSYLRLDNTSATGGAAVMCWQNGVQKAVFGVTGAILGDTSSDAGVYAEAGQGVRFYSNGTERMRIDSSGNVGIGTTTPTRKLTVYQNAAQVDLSIVSSTTGLAVIQMGDTAADNQGQIIYRNSDDAMTFGANGAERMRILSTGTVLVGKTAVADGTSGLTFYGGATGSIGLGTTGSAGTNQLEFFRGTEGSLTRVGSVQTTGSATSYNTSSDYRLKENIAPMTGALATVAQLKPVTYKWKSDGSNGQGFIAHELQEVVPDCVTGEKDAMRTEKYEITPSIPATYDEEGNELTPAVEAVMGEREVPDYQGVDTSFLVATLTAAIQELKAELDATKAEVQALKAK